VIEATAASPGGTAARSAGTLPPAVWLDGIRQAASIEPPWLWHGYLAPGLITLLTGLWKSGKTTLLAVLLARLKAGGTLAGRTVAPGKAVVVSEEGPVEWARRSQALDLDGQVCWLCRPFQRKPLAAQWLALVDHLDTLRQAHGLSLAVLDSLAYFLPGRDENSAALMLEALEPLRQVSEQGLAVLLLHHPSKAPRGPGLAARGSGALLGFVDVYVEMDLLKYGDDTDRRRLLRARSRLEQTPRSLVIELNAAGTDYAACPDEATVAFAASWAPVQAILEDASHRLSRREILEQWPEDFERPSRTTLWDWLTAAVERGLVLRQGTGHRNDAYRYWLPEQEAKWQADPNYSPELEAMLDSIR
jgi:hypothetical protein